MFILGNLIEAMAYVVNMALFLMFWLIVIRAVLSWVNPDPFNPIVQFITRVTEPVLEPIRRLLPPMGLDISPIIACVIIRSVQIFLVPTLYDLAFRLH